ncbi:MAG: DUF1573 domain-containing protein [Planctomycetota bacterium]
MKRCDCRLICLVVCSAVIWLAGCETGPPPKITFEKLGHDFGEITPNTLKKVQIKFTNRGEGVLRIKKVDECCGVVAKLAGGRKKYAPGESGAVEVQFTSGPKPTAFKRDLVVHSNDRANPRAKLGLRAKIVLSITWEPKRLRLFLDEDNAGCPKITIGCLKKRPFSITGFKSTGDCITADFDPSIKAAEFVLEPKVNIDKLSANLKGNVSIGVTHSDGNAAIVPFDVLAKYTVDPQVLLLTEPVSGKPIVKRISVVNNYNKGFEIESVSTKESSNMSVRVVEKRKIDNGYQLDVEMILQLPQGKGLFTDEFSVKIKGGEELTVPCRAWYSKKS